MTDDGRRSLPSQIGLYMSVNIVNALVPFLLLPILTRYLTPAEYGQVAIFQAVVGMMATVVGLNVAGAANRKYYEINHDKRELSSFLSTCLQIILVSIGVVFCVAWLFSSWMVEFLDLDARWILMAVIVAGSMAVIQLRLGQWQVRGRALAFGALQIAQSSAMFALALFFVVILRQGADGRIAAQVIISCAGAMLSLIFLMKDYTLDFRHVRGDQVHEVLSFGLPLIPHMIGMLLIATIDRVMVNAELGLAQAGYYAVAFQLATVPAVIFEAINFAVVPWLYERLKRDEPAEKRLIVRGSYIFAVLIGFGAVLGFAIGPSLIVMFAGQQYAPAGDIFGWLILGQSFFGMYLMVTNYVFYSKKTGMLSLVTLVAGVLNVILLSWLLRSIGLIGAAVAFAAAMAIRFVLTWAVAQRCHPMPWFSFKANS